MLTVWDWFRLAVRRSPALAQQLPDFFRSIFANISNGRTAFRTRDSVIVTVSQSVTLHENPPARQAAMTILSLSLLFRRPGLPFLILCVRYYLSIRGCVKHVQARAHTEVWFVSIQ